MFNQRCCFTGASVGYEIADFSRRQAAKERERAEENRRDSYTVTSYPAAGTTFIEFGDFTHRQFYVISREQIRGKYFS